MLHWLAGVATLQTFWSLSDQQRTLSISAQVGLVANDPKRSFNRVAVCEPTRNPVAAD